MMEIMAKLIEENAGHNKHDGSRNRESKQEEEWNREIKLMM